MASSGSAFVIGAGSAGCAAAMGLARSGWQVTIAEPGGVGGTCLWAGCVPKKALYVSTGAWDALRRDPRFGVLPGHATLDWNQVMAWKRDAQTGVAGDQEALLATLGIEHVPRPAKFVSSDEVAFADEVRRPDAVVIATGARTIMPDLPGIGLADTSGSALSYRTLPESLVIVGAGYIGAEFAAAYAPLGTTVTLIARGERILPMFDAELAAIAAARLGAAGVEILTRTSVIGLEGRPGRVVTHVADGSGRSSDIASERVLMAVGRKPATEHLDLDAAGIRTDERGRLVLTEAQQTTNPRVWACGDAAGTLQLKPSSELAGRAVARSIASGIPQTVSYASVPSTVFTLPQLAQVGLTEQEAAKRGIAVRTSRQVYATLPAAIIEDERDGLIKLLFAEKDGRLLGAAIAGPAASELIYACALGIRTGATEEDFAETVGIHAAFSEGLNFAALGDA